MRLGTRQLELLRSVGTTRAVVVADELTRRLCEMGMMAEAGQDSFAHITSNGLRALADAVDAGRIKLFVMPSAAALMDAKERKE